MRSKSSAIPFIRRCILELLLGLSIGMGLAAACGFRVFVPLTVMSAAALTGHLDLASGFDWVGTYPALLVLSTATAIEIAAYSLPWLDNLLDSIATPAAVVAGTVVTASMVGDISPLLQWTLAAIAGGGVAAAAQTGTVVLRAASSVTTGGLGNFVIATGELGASLVTATMAIWLPVGALLLIAIGSIWLIRRRSRRRAAVHGGNAVPGGSLPQSSRTRSSAS